MRWPSESLDRASDLLLCAFCLPLPFRYVFHYMVTDGLTYLCMSDQDFSRPLAFQFLNDIKDRFQGQMTEAKKRDADDG